MTEKFPNSIKIPVFLLFTFAVILSSCTTQKELTYLQDLDESGTENYFELDRPDYRIQVQDILYVQFYTLNEEVNNFINGARATNQQMTNESGLFLNGYNVNDSGSIIIPFIGEVYVLDKTVDEARKDIQLKSEEFLKNATVIVKLLSFKFSVLGEVNAPGTYRNFNNQLTVLEAISMAGDITDFGDRERVLVVRPKDSGTYTYRINLKTKDLLTSEAFFLLPNDIVIVEPINSKIFQLNIPTWSFVITTSFSVLSTTLLLISYFKNP